MKNQIAVHARAVLSKLSFQRGRFTDWHSSAVQYVRGDHLRKF